jgi:hypothetical protein
MWAGSTIHGLGLKAADFVRVFAMAKCWGLGSKAGAKFISYLTQVIVNQLVMPFG